MHFVSNLLVHGSQQATSGRKVIKYAMIRKSKKITKIEAINIGFKKPRAYIYFSSNYLIVTI